MKFRTIVPATIAVALVASVGPLVATANDIVEIRLRGRYYAEPASVRLTIAVEPYAENRRLLVEADSGMMYRSSEIMLDGAGAQRIHSLEFKNLPAGEYMLSAQVYSSSDLRGVATQALSVSGSGAR